MKTLFASLFFALLAFSSLDTLAAHSKQAVTIAASFDQSADGANCPANYTDLTSDEDDKDKKAPDDGDKKS